MTQQTITELKRAFVYGGMDLPDPNPLLSKEQVLEHYSNIYPKLNGGKLVQSSIADGVISYELRELVGEHG